MKISFDNANTNQNVDRVTTSYQDTRMTRSSQTDVFALDISGTVMDNNAYKGHGKTTEEVMQSAGQIDVALQRDYMTVMSNSMSAEDFGQMMKDGYHLGDMEIEEVVTIVDKIKAELIKGGTQVAGYTDNVDKDTLKEITGSEAFAQELSKQFKEHDVPLTEENVWDAKQAYDKAASLQDVTEGAAKYMVENHMEPTIDALYKADFSSTPDGDRQGKGYYADGVSGYFAKKADDFNWQQLQPQMEKVIEQAGLEVNEETLHQAKWLLEKGIPLTQETVKNYHALNDIVFPQKAEEIMAAIAAAIADGKKAGEANLSDGRSNLQKAADYVEKFANMTVSAENITARRQLEEIRLMMTIEANYKLLGSGFSLDTAELEEIVEALKQAEQERNQILFGESDVAKAEEKASLYQETCSKVAEIPYLPIDVVGKWKAGAEDFTLNQVHVEGSALRNSYEKAQEKYEELMSTPRADMGDSIKKAFRNVDAILQDMDLELSEENRRAIRILGYNSMELTTENIQAVKESDLELRRVIAKMTPAATLQAIRDGKNPLEMSLAQLNEYLDSSSYGEEQEEEKYSRFLYKLEQNKEITEQERDSYIGIYRLLRQIEKADDAVIGTLLQNGAELSFKNLLGALRSSKKHGMDYTVDDSFGGVASAFKNVSISEQIESGFGSYMKNFAGETADKMAAFDEPEAEAEYGEEQLQEFRQANKVDEAVVKELLNYNQPVTVNNLMAADMLLHSKGFLYKKLNGFTKDADKNKVSDAVNRFKESMTDKESAKEAYEEMQMVLQEVLEESKSDVNIDYIDLKAIQSCKKQLTLAGNLAQEENYHVPAQIGGEITAIHLKVIHSKEESKVQATLETESYGKVAAQFQIRNNKLSGYLVCSDTKGTIELQAKEEQFKTELQQQVESLVEKKLELGSISVVHHSEMDFQIFDEASAQNEASVQTADLYQVAKAFITVITA